MSFKQQDMFRNQCLLTVQNMSRLKLIKSVAIFFKFLVSFLVLHTLDNNYIPFYFFCSDKLKKNAVSRGYLTKFSVSNCAKFRIVCSRHRQRRFHYYIQYQNPPVFFYFQMHKFKYEKQNEINASVVV